jgi:polyphosphate kinase 2
MSKSDNDWYERELRELQIALVKFQQWAIAEGQRSLVVFEGRDGAGKDGAIKRITEYLSPRNTRVAALPKPSDRDLSSWYFQRYVAHLPAAGEIVLFNRSWYNRAGVEVVMEFSTPTQQAEFLRDAPTFERMLVESGIKVVKLWLDISKEEQAGRLEERREDPVKALKVSPLDAVAQKKWKAYSKARDVMLTHTHCAWAPWTVVHTDRKKQARINTMRHLLHVLGPEDISKEVPAPDPAILYTFDETALKDGRLEA